MTPEEPARGEIVPLPRTDPLAIIAKAIEGGMDPEKLGKLMDLSERWAKDRAAEAFAVAITAFQRDCPIIEKLVEGGRTKGGDVAYMFAPYEQVMAVAGPIMVRHGIVATFTTDPTERGLRITCRIRVGTHCENTTLDVPAPSGNNLVSAPQVMGQNLSYAKRYGLCAALNIVCGKEDNDAAAALDTLLHDEVKEVEALMKEKQVDEGRFLAWANVASVSEILRRDFPKVMDVLKRKKPNGGAK